MLSWNEYIEELLSTPTVLDNMSLRNNGNAIAVSPIVKASIQMLESMIETEGCHNVFVFTEIKELLYEFVISKIVFNVAAGKINIAYDLCTFKPGQKLKYKNCIVEFDKYVEKDTLSATDRLVKSVCFCGCPCEKRRRLFAILDRGHSGVVDVVFFELLCAQVCAGIGDDLNFSHGKNSFLCNESLKCCLPVRKNQAFPG